jgi:predicted dehydrogenase
MNTPRVALIGAAGHGASHLRRLTAAAADGTLDLVGVCDLRPIDTTAPRFTSHTDLLRDARPDAVVICTPPHTHLDIARDAASAGADLLLEKPPVLTLAEHTALTGVLSRTGRACQVGFQALGAAAFARLTQAIRGGALGTVTGIGAAGAWWRPDIYYARVPWAGRRAVAGRPVLDGALANPFAHAVMDALALAAVAGAARPGSLAVERYRAADIEVDDTACLRLRMVSTVEDRGAGLDLLVAVSLRSADFVPGEITVVGTAGRALLEYPTDRLALPGEAHPRAVPGRVDLLDNLLAHRADPEGVPLLAPLAGTEAFTAVIESVTAAPAPSPVPRAYLMPHEGGTAIRGVAGLVREAAAGLALFSELGVAWAAPPHTREVPVAQVAPA